MAGLIAQLKKWVGLQVASEAFLKPRGYGADLSAFVDALVQGNKNNSRMPASLAGQFVREYEALAHLVNDESDKGRRFGASATLFEATDGSKHLAFRSTEFAFREPNSIFDVGDILADVEVLTTGYAFGQIATLQLWYESLVEQGIIGPSEKISISGYSLGGHLAASFYLLNHSVVEVDFALDVE